MTSSTSVHPPSTTFVTVNVYVVVLGTDPEFKAVTVGWAADASLNPVEGDHEYVNPAVAGAPIVGVNPVQ
jgi:hypothetical protein